MLLVKFHLVKVIVVKLAFVCSYLKLRYTTDHFSHNLIFAEIRAYLNYNKIMK